MLDRISNSSQDAGFINGLSASLAGQADKTNQADGVKDVSGKQDNNKPEQTQSLSDKAAISDSARERYELEKSAKPYVSLILSEKETMDFDKVGYFKDMLDSGRINEYLRTVNTQQLADSLLESPAAAFLTKF